MCKLGEKLQSRQKTIFFEEEILLKGLLSFRLPAFDRFFTQTIYWSKCYKSVVSDLQANHLNVTLQIVSS